MTKELTVFILVFSSVFMIIGGLFSLHAWSVYEEARDLMQSTTDLVMRDFALGASNEGTDAD